MRYLSGESTLFAVVQAVDYIEAHLRDDITVADMAQAAGYSLYHFIRAFDQVVNHTPYNYLMRRRIAEAGRELADTRRRVIDVALDYRFHNHETFSRAFKRCFGLQPVQWRQKGGIPYGVLMPAVTLPYLRCIHRHDVQRPQLSETPERLFAGLMAPLPQDDPCLVADLQLSLEQVSKACWPDRSKTPPISVTWYLENGDAFYLAGHQVASFDAVPPMLVAQRLPAGQYASIVHRGAPDEIPYLRDYLLYTWLPRTALSPVHPIAIYTWETGQQREVGLPVCACPARE